ncbi:MAG: SDR family NAD(P)-dependent oxidoreductase, partial [Alphaproteobacteria bacterium]
MNNAGITGPNTTVWEYPPEEWRKVLEVDLTGPFLCARALVPMMIEKNYGRIVNIASIAGKDGNP